MIIHVSVVLSLSLSLCVCVCVFVCVCVCVCVRASMHVIVSFGECVWANLSLSSFRHRFDLHLCFILKQI